jgi:hypothetical protein
LGPGGATRDRHRLIDQPGGLASHAVDLGGVFIGSIAIVGCLR